MKKIIFCLVFGLLFVSGVEAKTYVLKDKDTDEVYIVSDKNNIINNTSVAEIVVLGKDIDHYDLTEPYEDYKLKNKKFILNTQKITDRENKKAEDKIKEEKLKNAEPTTRAKLIELGFTEDGCDLLLR